MNPEPSAQNNPTEDPPEPAVEPAPPEPAAIPLREMPVFDDAAWEALVSNQPPPSIEVSPLSDMALETTAIPFPVEEPKTEEPEIEEPEIDEPEVEEPKVEKIEVGGKGNPTLALHFFPAPEEVFNSSLTLDLICDSPTAEIRYALGADDVDESGTLFNPEASIFLTETTTIVARAFEIDQRGPLLTGHFEIRRAQWLELEPTDQTDATPHKTSEVLASPDGWRNAAASVRGKLHAHRGSWREDSFGLANIGEWAVTVVSDGAGSAPLSRIGSRLACAGAIESLQSSLGALSELAGEQAELIANDLPRLREALVASGVAALDAIRAEAETRGRPMSAFAATLLVLMRRAWNGAQLCASLQVGDGSIALWDAKGLTLLGEPDHGQHSSETRFLTTGGVEGELASRVKFSIKAELRAFAVMSDGVSDDFFPEDKRLGEVFDAVLPLVKPEGDAGEALLKWLGYEKKGSSDDRTLVVGWPLSAGEATDGTVEAADGDA